MSQHLDINPRADLDDWAQYPLPRVVSLLSSSWKTFLLVWLQGAAMCNHTINQTAAASRIRAMLPSTVTLQLKLFISKFELNKLLKWNLCRIWWTLNAKRNFWCFYFIFFSPPLNHTLVIMKNICLHQKSKYLVMRCIWISFRFGLKLSLDHILFCTLFFTDKFLIFPISPQSWGHVTGSSENGGWWWNLRDCYSDLAPFPRL